MGGRKKSMRGRWIERKERERRREGKVRNDGSEEERSIV